MTMWSCVKSSNFILVLLLLCHVCIYWYPTDVFVLDGRALHVATIVTFDNI